MDEDVLLSTRGTSDTQVLRYSDTQVLRYSGTDGTDGTMMVLMVASTYVRLT